MSVPSPLKKCHPVGVALLGVGRAGQIHLPNILANPRCCLHYIIEESQEKILQLSNDSHIPEKCKVLNFANFNDVLADDKVEGVIVATPTFTHTDLVMRALEAGKHVFCEKPLALNVEETVACYQKAKDKDRRLLVAFNRRFDESFMQLKKRLSVDKELGKLFKINTLDRDCPFPPRSFTLTSQGVFHDFALHSVDVVLWLAEEIPEQVFTFGTAHHKDFVDANDCDNLHILMKFRSGLLASNDISKFSVYGMDQRVEVHGVNGCMSIGNQHADRITAVNFSGFTRSHIDYSWPQRYDQAYKSELDHFIDAIQDPSVKLSVNLQDVLNTTMISGAAENSHKTGQPMFIHPKTLAFRQAPWPECE